MLKKTKKGLYLVLYTGPKHILRRLKTGPYLSEQAQGLVFTYLNRTKG